jgi:hypothetical protein
VANDTPTRQADLRDAFRVRDEHFERYQLDVLACRECAPPGSSFKAVITVDSELRSSWSCTTRGAS